MKESKFVKTKIVAGYLLLGAVCMLAVGYVFREMTRITAPDSAYALLRAKRNAVSQTLYHLYQAEGYGQLMLAGYSSYEGRYRSELGTVHLFIDSLRVLASGPDSLQGVRLDSIVRLLDDKQRRTMNLHRSIREGATTGILDKNIRQLIGPEPPVVRDTLFLRPQPAVDDSLFDASRRRFVSRVADLLRASPSATPPSVARHRDAGLEPAVTVRDTISLLLRALQDSIASERTTLDDRVWSEGQRLRWSNEQVNETIYRLISDFEAEDTGFLLRRIERTEAVRARSTYLLGAIALAALLVVFTFVGVLWRDVNRSNRYRRALEAANREKESLLDAREKLMLAITHDIKAPLGSILGYIDLLERLMPGRREHQYLDRMRQASDHLLALIGSLLDYYRLDIHKVEVDSLPFRPARLLEEVCAEAAPAAEAKGIRLDLEVTQTARGEVTGDPGRIRQIADNLVSNAVKFTDEGSVVLRADVADGRLTVSVGDTGRGITREERERIFDAFVRLPSARGVEGFGLGLSIVDRLVKLLGGRIWIDSSPGEGSRFTFSVPVGPVPERTGEPARPTTGLRVLAVDDDPLQLDLIAALLAREGVETVCCQYPEYAARLVAEERFDVVLTDLQMPSADGFGVLAAVRQVAPDVPVVAVSARSKGQDGNLAEAGFRACLHKPFSPAELLTVLAEVCGDEGGAPASAAQQAPLTEPVAATEAEAAFGALTAFAGDDRQAAARILESFASQNGADVLSLEEALSAHAWQQVRTLAHKMLPIFTLLGASDVAAALQRAEQLEGPPDEELRSALAQSIVRIRSIVAQAQKNVSLHL